MILGVAQCDKRDGIVEWRDRKRKGKGEGEGKRGEMHLFVSVLLRRVHIDARAFSRLC